MVLTIPYSWYLIIELEVPSIARLGRFMSQVPQFLIVLVHTDPQSCQFYSFITFTIWQHTLFITPLCHLGHWQPQLLSQRPLWFSMCPKDVILIRGSQYTDPPYKICKFSDRIPTESFKCNRQGVLCIDMPHSTTINC